ncbi:hypothetical protein P3X46_030859 [Hevea brasiliensis]|uniref:Uncharacterized protein n=1 Tax=Hevea brasiliensis TaxID=3981 RepID=A0ABQ9KJH5_HEVBR|nr:uncharacterized protein LOC110665294 [Hevea brasiliensis]KAJ9140182.1 hypothetical protein P3X46_030859 [Hevea brasiliensis]
MDSKTNINDSVGQGMTAEDGKVWSGSDTEDDFFSVKGDFSRSCSNASSRRDSFSGCPLLNDEGDSKQIEEKKKLAELFQDPFWSDQVDNRTKLFEFLQDECWSEEIASIHLKDIPSDTTTPGIEDERSKSKQAILHLSPNKETSSLPREELKFDDKIAQDHNRSLKNENAATASHCCFPSLSPRRSSRERRKGIHLIKD